MSENAAVYAFGGWLASILSYLIFLVWAVSPEPFLKRIGITYYPSRYYALALPAYLLVVFLLIGVTYMAINMIYTNDCSSMYTIRDEFSKRAPSKEEQLANARSVPDIGDTDIKYISYVFATSNRSL